MKKKDISSLHALQDAEYDIGCGSPLPIMSIKAPYDGLIPRFRQRRHLLAGTKALGRTKEFWPRNADIRQGFLCFFHLILERLDR